jgi:hypothetical protein
MFPAFRSPATDRAPRYGAGLERGDGTSRESQSIRLGLTWAAVRVEARGNSGSLGACRGDSSKLRPSL